MKINIPHMLIGLRELQHEHTKNRWEDLAYRVSRMLLERPWLYRWAARVMRWGLRSQSRGGWLSKLPGTGAGWTATRDFPAPARNSFRQMWSRGF